MKESLAIIILTGIVSSLLFEKIKLPGLLGMLLMGMAIGPYGLDILNSEILNISMDLRIIALIVILLRAGLGIEKDTLKIIGKPALRLSFIPGLFEGITIAILSMLLLDFNFIQGGMLGFILAAVSPAVVVPSMLELSKRGLGKEKGIPTMILSGASIDDVFAITIFTMFLGMYKNNGKNIFMELLNIPISIVLGVVIGIFIAYFIIFIFKMIPFSKNQKILIVLSISILFNYLEKALEGRISIASLLGIMAMGFIITNRDRKLGEELSRGFDKIWSFAQLLLFVLIGGAVNISAALGGFKYGIIIVVIGLIARSLGVYISLLGTDLNNKEKLFSIISYIPKATVQAAISGIPLSQGVEGGELILAIGVISILITAPVGAIGIKVSGDKLLK